MKRTLIISSALAFALAVPAFTEVHRQKSSGPAHAEAPNAPHRETYQIISAGPDTLASGQTMRYTWGNLNDPDPANRVFEPTDIQVTLYSGDGGVLAQKNAPPVEPGKFQWFDFHRNDLSPVGAEPLQIRLEIVVTGTVLRSSRTLYDQILATFDDHAEILDDLSGQTQLSMKPKEIVVVGSRIDPRDQDALCADRPVGETQTLYQDMVVPTGLASRQTLRLSIALPNIPLPRGEDYSMTVFPYLLDAEGSVIARRDLVTLRPGGFSSFDFPRAELPPGESGTDRLQLRAVLEREFSSESAAAVFQGQIPGSLEVVGENTSEIHLLIPAVQRLHIPPPSHTPTPSPALPLGSSSYIR